MTMPTIKVTWKRRPRTPREVLTRAAKVIRAHGLCQGDFYDNIGQVCAQGAMHAAITGKPKGAAGQDWDLYLAAFKVFKAHLGELPSFWNDQAGRTADQVAAALEAAAEAVKP